MRDKTINPNPPICRSKEPSFTYLTIYSCLTNEVLHQINHYNWNLTQAQAAANGGPGTYTRGYFYETAFKNYHDLDQNHCGGFNYFSVTGTGGDEGSMTYSFNAYSRTFNIGKHFEGPYDMPMSAPFDTWTLTLDYIEFINPNYFDGGVFVDAGQPLGPTYIFFDGFAEPDEGKIPAPFPLTLILPEPTWT
jgi:hypothetical protein